MYDCYEAERGFESEGMSAINCIDIFTQLYKQSLSQNY